MQGDRVFSGFERPRAAEVPSNAQSAMDTFKSTEGLLTVLLGALASGLGGRYGGTTPGQRVGMYAKNMGTSILGQLSEARAADREDRAVIEDRQFKSEQSELDRENALAIAQARTSSGRDDINPQWALTSLVMTESPEAFESMKAKLIETNPSLEFLSPLTYDGVQHDRNLKRGVPKMLTNLALKLMDEGNLPAAEAIERSLEEYGIPAGSFTGGPGPMLRGFDSEFLGTILRKGLNISTVMPSLSLIQDLRKYGMNDEADQMAADLQSTVSGMEHKVFLDSYMRIMAKAGADMGVEEQTMKMMTMLLANPIVMMRYNDPEALIGLYNNMHEFLIQLHGGEQSESDGKAIVFKFWSSYQGDPNGESSFIDFNKFMATNMPRFWNADVNSPNYRTLEQKRQIFEQSREEFMQMAEDQQKNQGAEGK